MLRRSRPSAAALDPFVVDHCPARRDPRVREVGRDRLQGGETCHARIEAPQRSPDSIEKCGDRFRGTDPSGAFEFGCLRTFVDRRDEALNPREQRLKVHRQPHRGAGGANPRSAIFPNIVFDAVIDAVP